MRDKLIYFLNKYGSDFFVKLPNYKTARYKNGEVVKLLYFSLIFLDYEIEFQDGNVMFCDLFSLDDFVL